jgi:hypothetical protein
MTSQQILPPDPAKSSAMLIGVHTFDHPHLENLPSVRQNISALQELLTSADILGLSADRCLAFALSADKQSATPDVILRQMEEMARLATDTFILYYAGYGETCGTTDSLYLALPRSDPDRDYTMIPYDSVRGILRRAGHAERKVIILDCCFGARSFDGRMSSRSLKQLALPQEVVGTVVLTSSAENRAAIAPVSATYTAFSGALISALRDGIPSSDPVFTVEVLYRHLRMQMEKDGFPEPQCSSRNLSTQIAVARNRAFQQFIPSTSSIAQVPRPVRQAEAEGLLAELARRKPVFDPEASDSLQWRLIRDYLMTVIQAFDTTPFPVYRSAGQHWQPVLLVETVLPRLAQLSDKTGVAEWHDLADQVYSTWISDEISAHIPEATITEGYDRFPMARLQARKEQETDARLRLLNTTLLLARQSASALVPDAFLGGGPLIEDSPTVIPRIPAPSVRKHVEARLYLVYFGLAAIAVTIKYLADVSWWIIGPTAVLIFALFYISWIVGSFREDDNLTKLFRSHYESHKPWKDDEVATDGNVR